MVRKEPVKNREEAEVISQCPECWSLLVWLPGQTKTPKNMGSVALFGENVKKVLCTSCLAKLSID